MKRFFSKIERENYILAWEPRGRWPGKDIEYLCSELDLVHVVDPFISKQVYRGISYYRLHGKGGYRYKYKEEDLERLQGFAMGKKETYFMFNNVYMFDDALALRRTLRL